MTSSEPQTSMDIKIIVEQAKKASKRAQTIEQERIKQGWRWIRISNQSKILVPCDKNGKPTKEGLQRINKLKSNEKIII